MISKGNIYLFAEMRIFPRSVCHAQSKNTHDCLAEIFLTDVFWVKTPAPKNDSNIFNVWLVTNSAHTVSLYLYFVLDGLHMHTHCLRAGGWWDWAWCLLTRWSRPTSAVPHSGLECKWERRETAPRRSHPEGQRGQLSLESTSCRLETKWR